MQDKIEFGLKILWDRDKVVAAIERDNVMPLGEEAFRRRVKVYGTDIDEDLAAKYPYAAAYLPVARLEDGSMTSW